MELIDRKELNLRILDADLQGDEDIIWEMVQDMPCIRLVFCKDCIFYKERTCINQLGLYSPFEYGFCCYGIKK